MAVSYGFFNSISGDRSYNADQMSAYFEGLVLDGLKMIIHLILLLIQHTLR